MAKPPAYQWYPKDILSDLVYKAMPWHVKGMYRELLDHAWLEVGLPNNMAIVKGLCGHPDDWEDAWALIGQKFHLNLPKENKDDPDVPYPDDRLHSHRQEVERDKQVAWREKSSAAGKKSARVRAAKAGAAEEPEPSVQPPFEPPFKTETANGAKFVTVPRVLELWHQLVPSLGKVRGVAGAREVNLRARIKEEPTEKFWTDYFKMVEASNFLANREGSGWHKQNDNSKPGCSFDWLVMKPKMIMVLEGKYDNGDGADQEVEFTGAGEPGR